MAAHVACHSSVRTIDHLSTIIKDLFPGLIGESVRLKKTKCSALIKNVLGPETLKEIVADIGDGKYSLILDESTDVSTMKFMCICIRYYSPKLKKIVCTALGMVEVPSTTAIILHAELTKFLAECKVPLKNLIGIGTDGANNMCGANHSLFTLLKADGLPHLQLFKCVCHSLHLCASEAVEELPSNLEFMLSETYKWFSVSPLRREAYGQIYRLINHGNSPLKIVAPSSSRWLSRYTAVCRVDEQYLELTTHFRIAKEKERCYTARTLHEMYSDKRNRLYIVFLKPLLADFQRVNILFQHLNADQFRLFQELKDLVMCILRRILRPSAVSLNVNLEFLIYYLPVDQVDFGHLFLSELSEADLPSEMKEEIKLRCHGFLKTAARSVLKRLPLAIDSLLKLRILSPTICLSQTRPRFADLPLSVIPVTEFGDMENQWRRLLEVDWNEHCGGELPKDSSEFWVHVLQFRDPIGEPVFQDLAKWALSLLSLPISNAVVERAFSMMNCVKSKLRNRMLLPILNAILIFRLWMSVSGHCCSSFVPSAKMTSFNSSIYSKNGAENASDSGRCGRADAPDADREEDELSDILEAFGQS